MKVPKGSFIYIKKIAVKGLCIFCAKPPVISRQKIQRLKPPLQNWPAGPKRDEKRGETGVKRGGGGL